jgi:hypothetical protein
VFKTFMAELILKFMESDLFGRFCCSDTLTAGTF